MPGERTVVSDEVSAADYDPRLQTVQALGALAMLLGTAGLVALPYGLIRFHAGAIAGDARVNFYAYNTESTSPHALWLFVSSLLGTGLALPLALGGWGCLRLHWWARPLLLIWAVGSLIVGGFGSIFYIRWLLPPWRDEYPQVRGVIDVHNILYIILGAAGILAAVTFITAQRYCQGMFAITFLLVLTGFMPFGIAELWGLLPLFGWNVMLHAVTCMLVYYYGFIYPLDLGGPQSLEDPAHADAI